MADRNPAAHGSTSAINEYKLCATNDLFLVAFVHAIPALLDIAHVAVYRYIPFIFLQLQLHSDNLGRCLGILPS